MVYTQGPGAVAAEKAREHIDLATCGVAHAQLHDTAARRGTGLDDEAAAAGRYHAVEGIEGNLVRPSLIINE